MTRSPAVRPSSSVAFAESTRPPPTAGRRFGWRRLPAFWRHFLEMLGAMWLGMFLTSVIFLSIVGLKSWSEVTIEYPTAALVAMATGMTIPMAAWMVYLVIPVVPFLCLVWFNVTDSAWCGAYCAFTVAAMLILMGYRREVYGSQALSSTERDSVEPYGWLFGASDYQVPAEWSALMAGSPEEHSARILASIDEQSVAREAMFVNPIFFDPEHGLLSDDDILLFVVLF
jgi:hypothetical protein